MAGEESVATEEREERVAAQEGEEKVAAEEGAERVATQEGAERVFGQHGCYVNKISATISHPTWCLCSSTCKPQGLPSHPY